MNQVFQYKDINFLDYEDFVVAIDLILEDRVAIAMAETPYVIDGPKVQ